MEKYCNKKDYSPYLPTVYHWVKWHRDLLPWTHSLVEETLKCSPFSALNSLNTLATADPLWPVKKQTLVKSLNAIDKSQNWKGNGPHVCLHILAILSRISPARFQKNLVILEWGFRYFYNCLDNQEEKSSKIKRQLKAQWFVMYCYFYLMLQQAMLLAALENVRKRHRLKSLQLARKCFHKSFWGYQYRIHWLNFQLVWTGFVPQLCV